MTLVRPLISIILVRRMYYSRTPFGFCFQDRRQRNLVELPSHHNKTPVSALKCRATCNRKKILDKTLRVTAMESPLSRPFTTLHRTLYVESIVDFPLLNPLAVNTMIAQLDKNEEEEEVSTLCRFFQCICFSVPRRFPSNN